MSLLFSSLRVVLASMLVCVAGYALLILGLAQAINPAGAEGSLIRTPDGRIVGSERIAQGFSDARYFWPRPSAVNYAADAAGGSNKSATSPDLAKRGRELVARYGASPTNPLPADLASASGAGLDPDISAAAALYHADRVAAARGLDSAAVRALIDRHAYSPGGPFTDERIVNVLMLNRALDAGGGVATR